jgi:endonuclease/exonuclease/phosphatase family metal-dependent hydrolase
MRILAYNIRHGAGMDHCVDLPRLAAVIKPLKADVVLLQEVDRGVERSGGADQMAELASLTGMFPYFGKFMDFGGGEYGMGILTRQEALEWDVEELPAGEEPRFLLWIRTEQAVFVGVHLYRTEAERLAQAHRLVEAFAHEPGPVVVAGDFNSEPDTAVMDYMAQHWRVAPKDGQTLTFPADEPVKEIDFALYRPAEAFEVVESRVVTEPMASDHRPVLLELQPIA